MEFLKKQSVGFYFAVLTAIIGVAATVLYFGNTKTEYFSNLGVNGLVVGTLVVAVICELVYVIGNNVTGRSLVLDLLPTASAVLFVVGTLNFVASRVNGIAAIMTFTSNESTMADLQNTIVAIAFCAVAIVLAIITSFFKVVKD